MSNFWKSQFASEGILALLIVVFLAPSFLSVTGPQGTEAILRGLNIPFDVQIRLAIILLLILLFGMCFFSSFWIKNKMVSQ